MALSLNEQDRLEPSASLDEVMLRQGYMRLLRAVHGSFARQAAALRCAEWVGSSETPVPGECVDAAAQDTSSDNVIVLSSESDRDTDQLTVEPLAAEPQCAVERLAWLPVPNTPGVTKKQKVTVAVDKAPSYAKLAHVELQSLAEKYGLRTNTPRRLLIHQLQTIWEQTNGKRPGDVVDSTPVDRAPERIEDVQLLFGRIRQHIRHNNDLFEQILCYRVLNFDAVYRDVSAAVKCQKSVLRKFFDLEGIVYSSYHD
ncbi:hypothetical protein GGI18_002797 [Coemansia linderi]|uniref:Uncharacterized protein n=1 Tax=Coemansia linderi TaxID=2663919 RepID=A0ACC1KEL0_9FUNG|nr:hypothetical protein GGI18_002797 [Coemansia linderi]